MRALAAVEQAFKARSMVELDAIMKRAFAEFGISNFNAAQLIDATGAISGKVEFGRSHGEWGAHYVANENYRHDNVIRGVIGSPSPLWWADMKVHPAVTKRERELYDEARAFGLKDGFVTPVHNTDGTISMIVLMGTDPFELSLVDQTTLRMLSLYYYSFGASLLRNAAKTKLTDRQRECLQWVRAGKTSWEISTILGIAERTVLFHVSEACGRLGVQTRAQAVAEAVAQGLIGI